MVFFFFFFSCAFCGIAWCHDQNQQLFYCCSVAKLCLTLCNSMDCGVPSPLSATISQCVCVCVCVCVFVHVHACTCALSYSVSWSLLKLMSIELGVPSNHLILCHLPLVLPSIFSSIRVFSDELALHIRWPKYCSFSISPSNEYSVLIFFRID